MLNAVLAVALLANALYGTYLWRSAEPKPHYGIWMTVTLVFLPLFAFVAVVYVPVTLWRRHGAA